LLQHAKVSEGKKHIFMLDHSNYTLTANSVRGGHVLVLYCRLQY